MGKSKSIRSGRMKVKKGKIDYKELQELDMKNE
jgi:hypothetical protein